MYGFFAYRMRNRADAEDLTQQTFERALKAWSRYDPAQPASRRGCWRSRATCSSTTSRADRSARRQPLDELDGGHDALVAAADEPDLGLEPDLEQALASLGAREREIIALRFGGELSGPEIAEAHGAERSPTCSRSCRARCGACAA